MPCLAQGKQSICSTEPKQQKGGPSAPLGDAPGAQGSAPPSSAPAPSQPLSLPRTTRTQPAAPVQTCTRSWAGSALAVLPSQAASSPGRRPRHLQEKPTGGCPSWAGAGWSCRGAAAALSPALAMLHPAALAGIRRCKALRAGGLGAHRPAAGGRGPGQVPPRSASPPPGRTIGIKAPEIHPGQLGKQLARRWRAQPWAKQGNRLFTEHTKPRLQPLVGH